MYVLRWSRDGDYYSGGVYDYPWSQNLSSAKLFSNKESIITMINHIDKTWLPLTRIEYIHPLNIV